MHTEDVWDIGTLHKGPIWLFYGLSNVVAFALCAVLLHAVWSNARRTGSDVFCAGVAFGALLLAGTCGVQCFLNASQGKFYGGRAACQVEAIAHVSSILTEFFCVTGVSWWAYLHAVRAHDVSPELALRVVVAIWVGCLVVTGLASIVSPIYLMSAGTYCFFGFSSPAIAGWLVPGLLGALFSMFFCHYKIVRHLNSMLARSVAHGQDPPAMAVRINGGKGGFVDEQQVWKARFRARSSAFMWLLLLGWGFAAVTCVVELSVGRAPEWLVTGVGVGGVSYGWAMPLAYACSARFYRRALQRLFGWVCVPCCGLEWWRALFQERRRMVFVRPSKQPQRQSQQNSVQHSRASQTGHKEVVTPTQPTCDLPTTGPAWQLTVERVESGVTDPEPSNPSTHLHVDAPHSPSASQLSDSDEAKELVTQAVSNDRNDTATDTAT